MAAQDMMVKSMVGGWLRVRLPSGAEKSIPEYCQVRRLSTVSGRDQLTVLEGSLKNQSVSVITGYLTAPQHSSKAVVSFYLGSNVISWSGGPPTRTVGNRVTGGIPAFTSPSDPLPPGVWDIEVPDHPHEYGQPYVNLASHAVTWFRVATPKTHDRYLHPGTVSKGCATIGLKGDKSSSTGTAALRNYELLYAYLIQRRKSVGVVGQLQVFDY